MQGWKVLLVMFAGALLFFLAAALVMPSSYQVARPVWIPAPPSAVFDVLADLHTWDEWSIWGPDKDPSIRLHKAGPARAMGASVTWQSERYGSGKRVVTELRPPSRMTLQLTHGGVSQPAIERITLTPLTDDRGAGTRVVWGMAGDVGNNLLARLRVGIMQRSAARDYEENLWLLKAQVERKLGLPPAKPPPLPKQDR